ncbi:MULTISPECIES: sulfurtransferase [Protofrankia]|uniref:Thiosulfate sulfurtransferase n=1 Tax=Candidatus Protofrankia datiscae TaxID=2716812 RepID=F8AX84_9ACTN|nr:MULTISPECIES: thiosulfate sulfurtransferase [Protofrankia]AEH08433.1 thiosulfate sulfurtransferase [Candidatus Protofrankia datiscae]
MCDVILAGVSRPLSPLIDAAALAARLGDPALRVFDATAHISRPPGVKGLQVASGRPDYERAHIPGAAFVDLAGELSDPDAELPFTLPDAERFAAAAGRLSIGTDSEVVVYAHLPG